MPPEPQAGSFALKDMRLSCPVKPGMESVGSISLFANHSWFAVSEPMRACRPSDTTSAALWCSRLGTSAL